MTARQQWTQGLQWGACAWLGYIVARTVLDAAWPTWQTLPEGWEMSALHSENGFAGGTWLMAAVWLGALALVAFGSRWSRVGVAAAIVAQTVVGLAEGLGRAFSPEEPVYQVVFALTLFVPMCLPLLPLVVMRAEQPSVVFALVALGRWREARARFGGVGPLVAAGALVSLHCGTNAVLRCFYHGSTARSLVRDLYYKLRYLGAWNYSALSFGLAALVIWATARRLREETT